MDELLSSLGPVTAVIGAQWGDEGKGKVVDILAEHFDVIARAGGGANAGHTIVVGGKKHVFHLLPSGCLHDGKPVVLGAGMVIHLPTLIEEIEILKNAGIDIIPRLKISHEAHIVFDFHKEIDKVIEERRSGTKEGKIGTTGRGIGPAYVDKAMRTGIRMESADELRAALAIATELVKQAYGVTVDTKKEVAQVRAALDIVGDCVDDAVAYFYATMQDGASILIEGAQGALLDIDHGTYPYVTSSATSSAGAMHYLGLPPMSLTSCIGIAKAYCTRVGSGEFPAEATDPIGARLRERGGEYGVTTGRPRRCGWLNITDLKRVAMVNGITHWNITKLDVLDEEETIPVATQEETNLHFDNMPGWRSSTVGITSFGRLPENAQRYITMIEEKTGIPAALIGPGPDRANMIVRG